MKSLLILLLAVSANALDLTSSGGAGCTTNCTIAGLSVTGTAPSLNATGAKISSGGVIVDGTSAGAHIYAPALTGSNPFLSGYYAATGNKHVGLFVGSDGAAGYDSPASAGHVWTSANTIEHMRLDGSGRLGIGTASPNAKLDVTGAAMFGTGGTQSTFTATGFFQPYSRTTLQLSLLAPSAVGQYIDNSTIGALCRSTGTSAGNWALATAAGTGCF